MATRDELKQWRDKGILRDVARPYINRGIEYKDALDWIYSKIDDEEAALYAALGATYDQALYWYNNGQSAYSYRNWVEEGLTHEDAIPWIEAGFQMDEAAGWMRYERQYGPVDPDPFSVAHTWKKRAGTEDVYWFGNGFKIDDVAKLLKAGIYFWDARELMMNAGMTVDEAIEWSEAGFGGSCGRMFFQYKATIEQAKAWTEAGHHWTDYDDCHDRETGDLIPRKYDELVAKEASNLLDNLPASLEHIDHCIENESFEMMEQAYNEAKTEWASAAIKIAQVFERVEARRAERIARDVAALKEAAG